MAHGLEAYCGDVQQRVIDSIRLGLAIELSQNPLQVLAALTRDARHEPRHFIAN